jgi:BioD-like phosphotransacetylase family protein
MVVLLLVSPEPLAGKTTVAAGLEQRLQALGRGDVVITEARAGDSPAAEAATRIVVVAAGTTPADLAAISKSFGESAAGVIVNRVPRKRMETTRAGYEAAGINVLAMLPEDRILAAPTLGEIATALNAEVSFLNGNSLRPVERPLIASISADPGQGYFTRHGATAVIIRSDKPDLQLAAINAGANCLIVTGGLPILSYVLDRAAEDELPLLRTKLDTMAAVHEIEALFGTTPFAGGEAKLRRIGELLGEVDISALM